MCVKYESGRTQYFLHGETSKIVTILCVSVWALPPPAPPVDSFCVLSHRCHNTYLIDLIN